MTRGKVKVSAAAMAAMAAAAAFAAIFCTGCTDKKYPTGGGQTEPADSGVVYGDSITYGGETYQTVVIGKLTWLARNLNYAGEGNELGTCFNDDAVNCETYGRMYDWYTAITVCPAGWNLPNEAEWSELMRVAGTTTKLKTTDGWIGADVGTDDYGFSALPGGRKGGSLGWRDFGERGNWWSVAEIDDNNAKCYTIRGGDGTMYNNNNVKGDFNSVRCVKDNAANSTYEVKFDANGGGGTPPSARTVPRGSVITLPDGSGMTRGGYVFGGWNTVNNGNGRSLSAGSPYMPTGNVTLYVKWDDPGAGGVAYGVPVTYGGETYQTLVLGNQTWLARNLNYRGKEDDETEACYIYEPDSCAKYGRLYNWHTAKTACPAGWHLPDDGEWTALIEFAGGMSFAAKKLKAVDGWGPNSTNTDDYGFSALPGGRRTSQADRPDLERFQQMGDRGNWWVNTQGPGGQYGETAVAYSFRWNFDNVYRFDDNSVEDLHSVRCVKD